MPATEFGLRPYACKGTIALYSNNEMVRMKRFADRLQRKLIMKQWEQDVRRLQDKKNDYSFLIRYENERI